MLFNSIQFILFFPAASLLYYLVPARWRYIWLVIISYFFYACFSPLYLILLLADTLVTYLAALGISHVRKRHADHPPRGLFWLTAALTICLGLLFYFKYYDFLVGDVLRAAAAVFPELIHPSPALAIALPAGISFYTFESLGYVFDVYNG